MEETNASSTTTAATVTSGSTRLAPAGLRSPRPACQTRKISVMMPVMSAVRDPDAHSPIHDSSSNGTATHHFRNRSIPVNHARVATPITAATTPNGLASYIVPAARPSYPKRPPFRNVTSTQNLIRRHGGRNEPARGKRRHDRAPEAVEIRARCRAQPVEPENTDPECRGRRRMKVTASCGTPPVAELAMCGASRTTGRKSISRRATIGQVIASVSAHSTRAARHRGGTAHPVLAARGTIAPSTAAIQTTLVLPREAAMRQEKCRRKREGEEQRERDGDVFVDERKRRRQRECADRERPQPAPRTSSNEAFDGNGDGHRRQHDEFCRSLHRSGGGSPRVSGPFERGRVPELEHQQRPEPMAVRDASAHVFRDQPLDRRDVKVPRGSARGSTAAPR